MLDPIQAETFSSSSPGSGKRCGEGYLAMLRRSVWGYLTWPSDRAYIYLHTCGVAGQVIRPAPSKVHLINKGRLAVWSQSSHWTYSTPSSGYSRSRLKTFYMTLWLGVEGTNLRPAFRISNHYSKSARDIISENKEVQTWYATGKNTGTVVLLIVHRTYA